MTKLNSIPTFVLILTLTTLVAACDETSSEARAVALPDGGTEVLGDAAQTLDGDGGVVDAALPPQARTYLFEGAYSCVVDGAVHSTRNNILALPVAVSAAPVPLTVSGDAWAVTYASLGGSGNNSAPLLTSGYYTGELHAQTDVGVYPSTDLTLSAQRSNDANAPDITLTYVIPFAGTDNYDVYTLTGDCTR